MAARALMPAPPQAPAPPPRATPVVEHEFDGDVKILHESYARRQDIRSIVTKLHGDIETSENQPVQIHADIKITVGGKEHTYTVKVASPGAANITATTRGSTNSASSPAVARTNGKRSHSLSHANADDDDDVVEISSSKRPRLSMSNSLPGEPSSLDPVINLITEWRSEWKSQGGWMFDSINAAAKARQNLHVELLKKSDAVQDTLGQALNASSASSMTEFGNVTKLIHWLESCRQGSADKVQQREEKWRSSSASFHDQSRRDREQAEKRIEAELQKQRQLLIKIAKAGGVDVNLDFEDEEEDDDDFEREPSLGAQLTAELADEVNRTRREKER